MSQRLLHKIRNRLSPTYFQAQMNYWADVWDLDEATCPCDIHFNEWVAAKGLTDSTFYHFGTGNHHAIGIEQAQNGSGNRVFAITASIDEHRSYIKLVTRQPEISRSYLAYFGDIYLTNLNLLPSFDAVTLFHLCEFSKQEPNGYPGLDDLELLNLMTDRLRAGGHVLFYTGSFAYAKARDVIAHWRELRGVEEAEAFKSLLVYRKVR
jgi:hypothetical protein